MDFHNLDASSLSEFLLSGNKKILIITGEKNSGKSSKADEIVKFLQKSGKNVQGIISIGIFSGNDKTGYNAVDISTGKTFQLASVLSGEKFRLQQGKYYFNQDVFNLLNETLNRESTGDIIILDEVGYLELNEEGFYSSIENFLKKFKGKIILIVRESLLENTIDKFKIDPKEIELIKIS